MVNPVGNILSKRKRIVPTMEKCPTCRGKGYNVNTRRSCSNCKPEQFIQERHAGSYIVIDTKKSKRLSKKQLLKEVKRQQSIEKPR